MGLLRYNTLDFKFSNFWSQLMEKRAEKAGPGTPTSKWEILFTKMHHTTCSGTRKEKLLNFLEIKVQLRKVPGFSPNPKMQKGSDRVANQRSQIWYPRTSKNMTGERWTGLPKMCPSESRSPDYHLSCHPKCQLVEASRNLEYYFLLIALSIYSWPDLLYDF